MSLQKCTVKVDNDFFERGVDAQFAEVIAGTEYPFLSKYQYGYSLRITSHEASPTFIVESIDSEAKTANIVLNSGFEIPVEALGGFHLTFMNICNGQRGFALIKDLELVDQLMTAPVREEYRYVPSLEYDSMVRTLAAISNEEQLKENGFGRWVAVTETSTEKYFVFVIATSQSRKGVPINVPQYFVLKGEWDGNLTGTEADVDKLTPLHKIDDPEFFTGPTYFFDRFRVRTQDYNVKDEELTKLHVTVHEPNKDFAHAVFFKRADQQRELDIPLVIFGSIFSAKVISYGQGALELVILVRNNDTIERGIELSKKTCNGVVTVKPIYSVISGGEFLAKGYDRLFDSLQLHTLEMVVCNDQVDSDDNNDEAVDLIV